ncbi:MAG: histidine kinase [Bacteroidetes bacterium]|nr:histidine kinase [Bacteroidota bacterium]
MKKLKYIYSVVLICLVIISDAQTLHFDNYSSKNGLISDEVYKLFQDKKGYLWLFTNYGVMKYNGKQFYQVLKNLPFNDSFIYSYYESQKGDLWIANSNAKIYSVKNDSAFLVKGTERLSEKLCRHVTEILDLFVDNSCNIIISTKKGTFKLNKNENYASSDLITYTKRDSLFITILQNGKKLIGSINNDNRDLVSKNRNGFFYLGYIKQIDSALTNYRVVKFNGRNPAFNPKCFNQFNGKIYFSNDNQIIKIKDEKASYISLNTYILNFSIDTKGHLWVGTLNDGLYEIDEKDSIINHYLNYKTINHVLIDSQNGLWLSTDGEGIYYCKNVNEYSFNEYREQDEILKLVKVIDGKIFVSNSLGTLYMLDNRKLICLKKNDKNNTEILDITKYHKGYILSYRFNLEYIEFDKSKIRVEKLPPIKPAFFPLKIVSLGNDSLLCIGRKSILFLKNGIKSLNYENKIIDLYHKINSCESRHSEVIFGTEDGVYLLKNNKLVQPDYLETTKNSNVTKIVKDNYGSYWFCSKGYGLYRLNKKNEIRHYIGKNELPSNVINDVFFDFNNEILLSTNRGLYQFLKHKKWVQIFFGQVKTVYGYKNDIYFNACSGLVIQQNRKITTYPKIYFNIASILINNSAICWSDLNDLKNSQNNIEFNFDVISFSSDVPDVSYELNGGFKQAGVVKKQQVILQNLTPGSYTLTASLVNAKDKSSTIVIPFAIKPAFWQTFWFKVFITLICLATCYFIGWKIFDYYRIKENKRNEANRLVTEYKLIALKAQINPHFISNCLTAIQQLIVSNKLDEANQYLAKFSFLVRQVLNFSSKSFVSLYEELEITKLNIELEKLRFEDKFEYIIEMNLNIDLKDIFVPPLIFQPIVENAIWHGLLPLKQNKKALLKIKIEELNNFLNIIIEDNGVGRINKSSDIGNSRDSKGIKIVKQRIQNLSILSGDSEGDVLFEDLIDNSGNANGLRVKILLPIITIADIKNEN